MLRPDFQLDQDAARRLLGEVDTRAATIYTILLAAYGAESLHGDGDTEPLDPVTLYNLVEEDFRVTFPVENENKLQAVLLALESDLFFTDPVTFTSVTLAFAQGDLGDMVQGVMEDISLPEALWALMEVQLLRDDEPELGPLVQALVDKLSVDDTEEEDGTGQSTMMTTIKELQDDLRAEFAMLGIPQSAMAELDRSIRKMEVAQ